jgi:hypothetical protein
MVSVKKEALWRGWRYEYSLTTYETRSIRLRQPSEFGKKEDETNSISQPITNSQSGWDTIIVKNWVLTMMSRHPLGVIQEAVSEWHYISPLIWSDKKIDKYRGNLLWWGGWTKSQPYHRVEFIFTDDISWEIVDLWNGFAKRIYFHHSWDKKYQNESAKQVWQEARQNK